MHKSSYTIVENVFLWLKDVKEANYSFIAHAKASAPPPYSQSLLLRSCCFTVTEESLYV